MFLPRLALILMLQVLLSSCAGMQQALKTQNLANSGLRPPTSPRSISVTRDLDLSFNRGAITTTFTAHLASGSYPIVASSDNGSFYLAPFGSFDYSKQGDTESRVGGIYIPTSGEPQVWLFSEAMTEGRWAFIRSGTWISHAQDGLMTVVTRPWVESDFKVPAGAISH